MMTDMHLIITGIFIKYVYHIKRDNLFADLFAKLAK